MVTGFVSRLENINYKRYKVPLYKIIFSRFFIIVLLVIWQIFLLFKLSDYIVRLGGYDIFVIFNFIATILILNSKKMTNSYKIMWIILFNIFSITGVVFYFFYIFSMNMSYSKRKLGNVVELSKRYYKNNDKKVSLVNNIEKGIKSYLTDSAKFYIYDNKYNKNYFINDGEQFFSELIKELNKAKKFIFIESFIVSDGIIWDKILNILKKKAASGVKVLFMYDGLNSISSYKDSYKNILKKYSIEAKMFEPLIPLLSTSQNNRDHRKIFIIDNEVAFTGGFNIADEYANIYERFGHWKDGGIKIVGSAVESFTIMFLQVWYMSEDIYDTDYNKYVGIKSKNKKVINKTSKNSYICPYTDYPNDKENVSEQLFKMMINTSTKHLYITTPYLVVDESMVDALNRASKRGVDVRIFVPHIPDKKYVFILTRSHYKELVMNGIKIYEYTKGFIHEKAFIQDDERAIVGTVNFDYRSLYLNYENGVYIYNDNKVIKDIKKDIHNIIKSSEEMTINKIDKFGILQKIFGPILKIFAPLF